MATTVVGLFDHREDANHAIQDLMNAGFDQNHISVLANDASGEVQRYQAGDGGTLASEGAATGLTSGAVVGGLLGLLIGAGAIFLPLGVIAAGPIAGLIAGGVAGAATGGILGGLIGLGIPDEYAGLYAEGVRRGGTLVTVLADEGQSDRAHLILDRDGAVNIEERGTYYRQQGFSSYDHNAPAYSAEEAAAERERYATTPTATPVTPTGAMTEAPSVSTGTGMGRVRSYPAPNANYAYADSQPGIQTGGHAIDGTPDTRGITEKVADAVTGDRIDDKTGKTV